MTAKIILLSTTALAPFLATVGAIPGLKFVGFSGSAYLRFCLLSGSVWILLFVLVFVSTPRSSRRTLLWFLPLCLFAFAIPADFLYLGIALAQGDTPP
jgi:hypothetical protein